MRERAERAAIQRNTAACVNRPEERNLACELGRRVEVGGKCVNQESELSEQ